MPYDGCTYLGAVSVDNDNSKALIHKRRYLSCSRSYVLILFFECPFLIALNNGVPAEGENRYGSPGRQSRFVSSKEPTRREVPFVSNVPVLERGWVFNDASKLQTRDISVR